MRLILATGWSGARQLLRDLFSPQGAYALAATPFAYGGPMGFGPPGVVSKTLILIVFMAILFDFQKTCVQLRRSSLVGVLLYFFFLNYLTIALLWSPSTVYGYEKVIRLWTKGVILFLLALWVFSSISGIRRFMVGAAFGTVILSIRALMFYIPVANLLGPNAAIEIMKTTIGNYQSVSTQIAPGAIAGIGLMIAKRPKLCYLVCGGSALGLALLTILYMGGHSSALALLVAWLFYLIVLLWPHPRILFLRIRIDWRHVLAFTSTACAVWILFVLWSQPESFRAVERAKNRLEKSDIVSTRKLLRAEAFRLSDENPYFGTGTGGFPKAAGLGDVLGSYPHNIELELLAENGVVGLTLFGILILWIGASYLYRRIRLAVPEEQFVVALFLGSMAMAQVGGDLTTDVLHVVLGAMLARAVNSSCSYRRDKEIR